jgi:sugar-specific transcriptional regulator TrmB
MDYEQRGKLEQLGLSAVEAGIYLTLLKSGPLSASAIAIATQIPRTSVYPTLASLVDKGLIEDGAEHGSRFSAVPPDAALSALIAREEETLRRRSNLVRELAKEFSEIAESNGSSSEELVQVLRNPHAVAERLSRLELEAEHRIEAFVKPPFFNRTGNSPQAKAMRRGVRVRAVYDKQALEDPAIKPFLKDWVSGGEEMRVYESSLPHKMVIIDSRTVLLPLIMPGDQPKSILIRNAELGETFSLAFQHVWERSAPFPSAAPPKGARKPARRSRRSS